MSSNVAPAPAIIVIFGITGDLVKKKLLPALSNLIESNLLNEKTTIVGITRQKLTVDSLLNEFKGNNFKPDQIEHLKKILVVRTMDITKSSDYGQLLKFLNEIEDKNGACMNRLYYLAIPPQVSSPVVRLLGENGLNASCQHNNAVTRLLVEKPFGYDTNSAQQLIEDINKYFSETQVFRIDHYLAKETVQNILAFRFNNAIFESLWNSHHIASINICASEEFGIENRVIFYEQTGAVRDIIQSHLLQLLSIVTMEQPRSLSSEDIHSSKLVLLKSVSTIPADKVYDSTIRGQYSTYRQEVKNPHSNVETYAAIRININNKRWSGVPIIVQTGKSLKETKTTIKVIFRRTSHKLTNINSLTFRIQPDEGINLELCVKKPGFDNQLENVDMDFSYSKYFSSLNQPGAYERVLVDAIKGDHTLFATSPEIMETWRVVDPVLQVWSKDDKYLHLYKNNASEPDRLLDWLTTSSG